MTPNSNYKMSKATKTWLARNKLRLPAERFSTVKKSLIESDIAAQIIKSKREPNNG